MFRRKIGISNIAKVGHLLVKFAILSSLKTLVSRSVADYLPPYAPLVDSIILKIESENWKVARLHQIHFPESGA